MQACANQHNRDSALKFHLKILLVQVKVDLQCEHNLEWEKHHAAIITSYMPLLLWHAKYHEAVDKAGFVGHQEILDGDSGNELVSILARVVTELDGVESDAEACEERCARVYVNVCEVVWVAGTQQ